MVSSIDGAAQGPDGRSGTLSNPADQRLLGVLRALADVVLVGAGTARAEHYGPVEPHPILTDMRARYGQPPAAPMAVVSRRLELHPSSPLFTHACQMTGAEQRTMVFTVDASPVERRSALAEVADVIIAGDADIDVKAVREHLATRGLRRVLCEGGPQLLAHVVRAGHLDELCFTMTPALTGGYATHILDGEPIIGSDWQLAHIIEDASTLFTRWLARA
ncbi:pyrimidine reductase family protein [Actinobacteria bacterium YIM 96077]|uniref:Pyrimidine reductase family protein n=2 Tax=Phytoactinopolyspora halophila TaxID=1981511 RepID=A0A329QZT9_9ACTN|nr:pyrimidine reductase family protein [Actinobacteria bacterium YIM 96077]RAW17653.1 pyrimidine reductase family protein [Phytoactinopolyspora halophila]